MMKKSLAWAGLGLGILAALPAAAEEHYIGEPVVKNDMQIVPNYLTDIKMSRMPKGSSMKSDAVHLEVDIHATGSDKHGFTEDAWIPYLTVHYTLQKEGSSRVRRGLLLPMTAGDGPHYANNVDFDGEGKYHLTYTIDPPSSNGFIRHVDDKTGVPDWWQSFSVDWTFNYPSEAK